MTRVELISALGDFIADAVKDFRLPVAVQKGDDESLCFDRAPEVFLMRLPNGSSYKKFAPYVIVQYVSGKDVQPNAKKAEGESTAFVRLIFCVYAEREDEGAMMLLNVMERVRIALLRAGVIGGQFRLDADGDGLEHIIYNDDTQPYYGGEIVGTYYLPVIEREWRDLFGIEKDL